MTRRSRTASLTREHPPGPRRATANDRRHAGVSASSRPLRLGVFAVIAVVVGGAALALVFGRLQGPAATDTTALQVHASMGGFEPGALTVTAGQTVRVEFSSMDTPYHSDGGGWHQLAIDELGIDWKVGPESSEVFEFVAPAEAGTYAFYCDICCGGKENPSMQGRLTVTA
ncbi:MAG TPA: cupredoxin domain-containing protein [Candidatus Limnocylindrales bacterium]|nr:cupredoxin domain-containing protein [Candidatus Limnocylindrales bacterium]